MIKKVYLKENVLTMAKRRIKNVFETSSKIQFSVSGGKDSIVVNDLIYKMCQSGEVDKSKLTVVFIDEEAIYPCVDAIVQNMRRQWLLLGVKFEWYCVQVKHFNAFNALTNDESFICWDETRKDVWIRQKPKFALTTHELLRERTDTYQDWLERIRHTYGYTAVTGVRATESIQRAYNIAIQKDTSMCTPIYDWSDTDIWLYIKQNHLDIPNAYIYMYQTGISKGRMRISQFFSIDTCGSLVNMCQFYPNLFNKICAREPNAYMAMLYYDTEMFRRKKRSNNRLENDDEIDYKEKTLKLLADPSKFTTKSQKRTRKDIQNFVLKNGMLFTKDLWKHAYNTLVGGDPKRRNYRSLMIKFGSKVANSNQKGRGARG